jgi:hypothetical protein
MTISEAKQRLSIPSLWARLDLPGSPKTACRSPFREDRHGSFSVSKCGRLFNDFATGEAGDAVDFLRLATGLSPEAAFTKFLEMAGGGVTVAALPKREQAPKESQPRQKPVFPAFERGTEADLHALADLRKISFAACVIARGAGLLHFATLKGHRAFVLTDDSRLAAQARRLDGQGWEHKDGAKAWTLYQSWGKWPLGLGTGAAYPAFMLCEGGPDLLAALHFIHERDAETLVFPLAMLGAEMPIHEDALPSLAGKRIRIFPHTDPAGTKAAERWAAQLEAVGADVDCFSFAGLRKADGSPVGDLNDCTSIHPEDAHELEGLFP